MNKLWIGTIALTTVVASVTGQTLPTQDGRALDANFRLGGAGYNSIRSVNRSALLNGNLYITGQVSGGFSFRGRVPYRAGNELRLTLPSETVDDFVRDSIGLEQVLSGRTYRPQPYYAPSRTVQTLHGGGSQVGAAPIRPTETPATSASSQTLYTPYSTRIPVPMITAPQVGRATYVPTQTQGAGISAGLQTGARPQASLLFGVLDTAASDRLAIELAPLPEAAQQVEPAVEPPGELEPVETPGEPEPAEALTSDEPTDRPFGTLIPSPKVPDDDVFTEVISELIRHRNERFERAARTPQLADTTKQLEQLNVDPSARTPRPVSASPLVETAGDRIILHGLAGRRSDGFNRYMALGDERLKSGQFYQAAESYQAAQEIDRGNPLASIGAGLAYFGAGEVYRASHFVQRALKLFPAFTEVRIDVDRLLGHEVVTRRLADVVDRLTHKPLDESDTSLVFLAAYMYAGLDLFPEAAAWGRKLEPLAKGDWVLTGYARFLILTAEPAASPAAEAEARPPRDMR